MTSRGAAGDSKITLSLPQAVLRQLRLRTVADETTIRALMLDALAKAGYAVDMEEIRDRRRSRPDGNRALT
jgi:hypothetical protein